MKPCLYFAFLTLPESEYSRHNIFLYHFQLGIFFKNDLCIFHTISTNLRRLPILLTGKTFVIIQASNCILNVNFDVLIPAFISNCSYVSLFSSKPSFSNIISIFLICFCVMILFFPLVLFLIESFLSVRKLLDFKIL